RAIDEGRLQPLVDSGITWLARVLDQNEGLIRDLVEARTMWLLRLASLDERLANSIIEALRRLLNEMSADPEHPLRLKVMVAMKDFAFDLQFESETQARVEALKLEVIENPELGGFLDGIWTNAKTSLRASLADPGQALAGRVGEAARHIGQTTENDPALRRALNKYTRRAIVGVVADYGDELVRIVSDTVRNWDADTVTERVERAVGRDLQFIRINGTLVGGLVGLTIHAVTELL
ncbi:MAG: DUF445 domain-containing protein, partial [Sphingomonadaceae bacterium]|nr:DUF445 domain-containing protein [Sphingomonadaceae bacterium]